jgi:antitoxin MazE
MQLKVIHIGNSKGIRLPHTLIRQYHIEDYVEVELHTVVILLRPAAGVREGSEEQFRAATTNKEPETELNPWSSLPNHFDEEEWTW